MIVVMEWATPCRVERWRHARARVPAADGQRLSKRLLVLDLIPMVDATYRTLPDREQRALAGLSMGGFQALQAGLTHLETFAWIGAFSGAGWKPPSWTAYNGVFSDAEAFNRQVRLFWLSAGTGEEASSGR